MDKISAFIMGLVEVRDPYTASHQRRLASYASTFARHLSLGEEEAALLTSGAFLHDIGKLAISEHILKKPAKLSEGEYELIKKHCRRGADLLDPLQLHPQVIDIVLYHHENFDGSGYPLGLKGDEIPLLARIVRIIDSYDAITADRPYHKGVPPPLALKILGDDARFYDPDLLEQFMTFMNIQLAEGGF